MEFSESVPFMLILISQHLIANYSLKRYLLPLPNIVNAYPFWVHYELIPANSAKFNIISRFSHTFLQVKHDIFSAHKYIWFLLYILVSIKYYTLNFLFCSSPVSAFKRLSKFKAFISVAPYLPQYFIHNFTAR